MKQLPNNCRIGNISVHPKNWNDKKLHSDIINSAWYIKYRFYDDNTKQAKQIVIKGMNEYRTLAEKQDAVKELIDLELTNLQNGLNKITGKYYLNTNGLNISENTSLLKAMHFAFEKIDITNTTRLDMKSCLKYFSQSADQLKLSGIPLKEVGKKHIRLILDNIADLDVISEKKDKLTGKIITVKRKKIWSANQYNHFRAYIGMLFAELEEFDAISYNPALSLTKKKTTQKIKNVLTLEERRIISDYLKENNYRFYLFVNIFFHSGARLTEFGRLKLSDINLPSLSVKFTIKKGAYFKEVLRPIKRIALPFWTEYLAGFNNPDMFFLGRDLYPNAECIKKYQLTKRWNRWIKKNLGISKDLYSLKHLNLDETAAALSIEDAAAMAGYTSPVITMKHYAVGERDRQNEKLRKVANEF